MSRATPARSADQPPTPAETKVLESVTLGFSYAGTGKRLGLSAHCAS